MRTCFKISVMGAIAERAGLESRGLDVRKDVCTAGQITVKTAGAGE